MDSKNTNTPTDQPRSSIGFIQESENINGNLVQAQEHLMQALKDNPILTDKVAKIRDLRDRVLKLYATDVNIKLHCTYKHLISARTGLFDLLAMSVSKNGAEHPRTKNILSIIDNLEQELFDIRIEYLKIDKSALKIDNCMQCVEDYFDTQSDMNGNELMPLDMGIPSGYVYHGVGDKPDTSIKILDSNIKST